MRKGKALVVQEDFLADPEVSAPGDRVESAATSISAPREMRAHLQALAERRLVRDSREDLGREAAPAAEDLAGAGAVVERAVEDLADAADAVVALADCSQADAADVAREQDGCSASVRIVIATLFTTRTTIPL